MQIHQKPGSPDEQVADAEARLKVIKDLEKGAELINKTSDFPVGTNERRLVELLKNAVFYVAVRQLDGFRNFLTEMEKVDQDGNR